MEYSPATSFPTGFLEGWATALAILGTIVGFLRIAPTEARENFHQWRFNSLE